MEFAFAGRALSSITPAELVEHIENSTGSDSTFNSRATSIRTFWRWCSKLLRNWCDVKTIEVLEGRETRKSSIGVLTADQCRVLMRTAEEHQPCFGSAGPHPRCYCLRRISQVPTENPPNISRTI